MNAGGKGAGSGFNYIFVRAKNNYGMLMVYEFSSDFAIL